MDRKGFMNNNNRRLTVGILGGMGARASVRFYDEVIRICTEEMDVVANEDFPRLLIANLPLPDIIGSSDLRDRAGRMIAQEGQNLQKAGAECLIMACNTAHLCFSELQAGVSIPVLNLIEETVQALPPSAKRIGILATPTTIQTSLYQEALERSGREFILPLETESEILAEIIRSIIAGKDGLEEKRKLLSIVNRQIAAGAEVIVLGCTELGLAIGQTDVGIPLVDSVVAGARKVARLGLGKIID